MAVGKGCIQRGGDLHTWDARTACSQYCSDAECGCCIASLRQGQLQGSLPLDLQAAAAHHCHDAGAPQQHGAARVVQRKLEARGPQLKGLAPIDALPLLERLCTGGGSTGERWRLDSAGGQRRRQRQEGRRRSCVKECGLGTLRMKSRSLLDRAASASRCRAAKAPAMMSDGPRGRLTTLHKRCSDYCGACMREQGWQPRAPHQRRMEGRAKVPRRDIWAQGRRSHLTRTPRDALVSTCTPPAPLPQPGGVLGGSQTFARSSQAQQGAAPAGSSPRVGVGRPASLTSVPSRRVAQFLAASNPSVHLQLPGGSAPAACPSHRHRRSAALCHALAHPAAPCRLPCPATGSSGSRRQNDGVSAARRAGHEVRQGHAHRAGRPAARRCVAATHCWPAWGLPWAARRCLPRGIELLLHHAALMLHPWPTNVPSPILSTGFPAIRYARRVPSTGPSGFTLFAGVLQLAGQAGAAVGSSSCSRDSCSCSSSG